MKIQSFEELTVQIQSTDIFKDIKGTENQLRFIDYCHLFISFIFNQNNHIWDLAEFEKAYLNKNILRERIGHTYLKGIKECLQYLNVLKISDKYISTPLAKKLTIKLGREIKPRSKEYWLSESVKNNFTIKDHTIKSKFVARKNKHWLRKHYTELMNDPEHSANLKSMFDYHFPIEEGQKVLDSIISTGTEEQIKVYKRMFNALKSMNGYTRPTQYFYNRSWYFASSKVTGRVYSFYTNTPKLFRYLCTKKDGSELAEIDQHNAQPFNLSVLYVDYVKKQQSFGRNLKSKDKTNVKYKATTSKEYKQQYICGTKLAKNDLKTPLKGAFNLQIFQDTKSSAFYENVANQGKSQNDLDFYELYKNNYGKFKVMVLGDGLYYNYLSLDKIKPAERYLIDLYPEFMQWIRDIKKKNNIHGKGHAIIPVMAQTLEADMFIGDFFKDLTFWANSLHDAEIVEVKDVQKARDRLEDILHNRFPYLTTDDLKGLLGVTYYKDKRKKILDKL